MVAYLGHLITQDDVKPNPSKVECILNFPEPQIQKNIKSFLDLGGCYRWFIPNFGKISKLLTKLFQKIYCSECVIAYNKLKKILTSILVYSNCEEPLLLKTIASGTSTK